MELDLAWEFVADTVMGGVSQGSVTAADGNAARLMGAVSLENNGGFVQMAANLNRQGGLVDASKFLGVTFRMRGNGERYDIRLRTDALMRPWESFRTEVVAPTDWQTVKIPFSDFQPHRTAATFNPARLRRVGVLAIGRAFEADVSIAGFGFYR
ncbi:MAG: CIA30 family protein [Aestuariivita sp.]